MFTISIIIAIITTTVTIIGITITIIIILIEYRWSCAFEVVSYSKIVLQVTMRQLAKTKHWLKVSTKVHSPDSDAVDFVTMFRWKKAKKCTIKSSNERKLTVITGTMFPPSAHEPMGSNQTQAASTSWTHLSSSRRTLTAWAYFFSSRRRTRSSRFPHHLLSSSFRVFQIIQSSVAILPH